MEIREERWKFGCETVKKGWVCPKCGQVNAPWISSCPCNKKMRLSNYGEVPWDAFRGGEE